FTISSTALRPEEEGLRPVLVVEAGDGKRAAKVVAEDVPLQRLLEGLASSGEDLPVQEKSVGIHRVVADEFVSGSVKVLRPALCHNLDCRARTLPHVRSIARGGDADLRYRIDHREDDVVPASP